MSYNFLDKTGLTYFWDKIKNKFSQKVEDVEYTSTNNTLEIENDNTEASFDITEIDGNLVQNGTPTPSALKNINVITGKQLLVVEDKETPANRIINSQSFTDIPGTTFNTVSTLDGTTYQDCAVRANDTTGISSGYKDIFSFSKVRQTLGINFQKGEKYTLSFWAKRTSGTNNLITYFYGDAGYATTRYIATSQGNTPGGWGDGACNWGSYLTNEWKRFWVTYEINPTATDAMIAVDKHVLFRQYYGNKISIAGVCLQKGETNGEYVPYVEPTEINLGKQLFDKSAFKHFGAAGLVETDTGIRAYASNTGNYQYGIVALPNSEKLLGRTVTISASITKSASNTGGIVVYQINNSYGLIGNQIGSRLSSNGSITVTFPTSFSSNGTMFGLLFYANVEGTVVVDDYVDYDDVMVIEGSYAEPYADYFEPLEIAAIPDTDYKDKLLYQNGKWYKSKNVMYRLLNGNLPYRWNYTDGFIYEDKIDDYNRTVGNVPFIYCNYYQGQKNLSGGGSLNANSCSLYYPAGLSRIYFKGGTETGGLDEWKAYMLTHPVFIYYALAETIIEPITEPLLVKELNKLLDNREVNGTTYIELYGKNAVFTTFKANQTPVQKQLDTISPNVSEVVNKKQFTTADDLKCIDFREYTSIYGSANDQAGASFYFAQIKPDSFYDVWSVKYRIYASVPNQQQYKQMSDVVIYGSQSGSSFASFNRIYSTNYSCYTYHNLYRMKAAGFINGYGDILGVGLRNAANRTTSTYGRYFKIEILETHGCKVEMFDEMLKQSQIPWYNTTNYNDLAEMDGLSVGLQETGDSTIIWQLRHGNGNYTAYATLYRNMICFSKDETSLLPVNSVNNSVATTKELTTEKFNPFGQIFYYNSTTTVNANGAIAASSLYQQLNINLQYSFNTGTTLTTNKNVFVRCVPQGDGMVKLADNPITQDLPTEADGFVYIYLGHASSTGNMELHVEHPVYEFKDGAIRLYKGPSEAVYTATEKTKLAGIATGATANTGTVTSVAVKMNGASKGTVTTSGTIDLGTVITAHQDISGKQDKLTAQTAYTAKGTSTKVPQITTNTLGQVTGITEVGITYPTVDSSLSSTSTNAIQNKAVNTAISGLSRDIAQVEESLTEDIATKQDTLTSATDITVGSATLSKTSYNYNGGAIPGTKLATATTVPNLIDEVRYTNGQMGSVQLLTAYTLSAVTIPAGWYNYQYIPHRYGGIDGEQPTTDADNVIYGTLILYGMTANQGITYKINVNSSNRYLVAPEVYTTNDQVIGRWIDGKILYRKIIQFTPTVQNGNINHGISNLNQVVRIGGMFQRGTTKVFNPLPNNYTNWEAFIYDVSDTKFTYRFSANQWSAGVGQCYVWIEFTETT